MKKIEEINRFIKNNSDNQKQKFIPNLIKSLKELEFNPNQFQVLTTKIKDRKRFFVKKSKRRRQYLFFCYARTTKRY